MDVGVAAMTGTDHFAATATVGRLNNGGMEHGPIGLKVARLPRYMAEVLPEVGVETLTDEGLSQASQQHPPPPPEPTHHQVVVG